MQTNEPPLRLDPEHHYWLGQEELWGVSAVLKDNRLVDDQWFTEESRRRGTFIHAILAEAARGNFPYLPFVDEEYQGWCRSGIEFLEMLRADGAEIMGAELMRHHHLYRFAGTIDLMARWRGKIWLFDLKTGKAAKATRYQLAAYGLLDGGSQCKKAAVELQQDGSRARLIEYNSVDHFHDGNTFLAFLTASRARQQHGPKTP